MSNNVTLEELENEIDLEELFISIWAAVEYGNDKQQHKQTILDLINKATKES